MNKLNKRKDRSKAVGAAIKYLIIAVSGLVLFLNLNRAANAERIADSVGGEGLFLFLPLLWWLTERTIKDLVSEWKRLWREAKAERNSEPDTEELAERQAQKEVFR